MMCRAQAVVSGRILLVDCEDILSATAAATFARQAGIPTVVDIEDVQPGTDALLHQIDAIIVAEEFPSALTGHADLGRALEEIDREYRAPLRVRDAWGGRKPRAMRRPRDSNPFVRNRLPGQHRSR